MTTKAYRYVKPTDRVIHDAGFRNDTLDLINQVKPRTLPIPFQIPNRANTIKVRNESGSDVGWYGTD